MNRKIIVYVVLALLICTGFIFVFTNKTSNLSVDKVDNIKIASLPVPPKYKEINKEQDIKSIVNYLNSIELIKIPDKINGWKYYLDIKYKNGAIDRYLFIENYVKRNSQWYKSNEKTINFFDSLYPKLDYQEKIIK